MLQFGTQKSPKTWAEKLTDSAYFEAAIEKLHSKFASETRHKLHELQSEGFSFDQLFYDRKKLAKVLARDVSGSRYSFSPATIRQITIKNKRRTIYSFTLFDRIVHTALFAMLAEDIQPLFPAEVYSYIKGKDRMDAIEAFMQYIRKHRARYKQPLRRGFFVCHFDIKSYGESIPVTPSSGLWTELNRLFTQAYGRLPDEQEQQLLNSLIRPEIESADKNLYENTVGITDGAPITSLLLNLYVRPLDTFLSNIKGGFYARYGDDILFAHEDLDVFNSAMAGIAEQLARLHLQQNTKKTKMLFFNAAGRAKDSFKGSTAIEFLGMQLCFDGTAALKKNKITDIMHDIKNRISATVKQLPDYSLDEQGKLICSIVNKTLDPKDPMANPYAIFLRRIVNHRGQLKDVDYRIARLILETLTGDASVKKFRTIPFKKMRDEWKLLSVEYERNQ